VIVFEQHRSVGEAICCTGIIGKECHERFPIFDNTVLAKASSAKFFAPSGMFFRMSKVTPQAYVIDRVASDCALAQQAQNEGVEYLLAAKVERITPEPGFVRAEVERDGKLSPFKAKVVIISSGFSSRLSQRLGLGQFGDFALGAQAEVEVRENEEVELYFGEEIAPGFFAWLVPTSPGKSLAGLLSRNNPNLHLRNFLSSLASQGRIASPKVEIIHGGIPLTPLPKTYEKRVIAVGDAAGQVKPTTGGGIYYGLLCADIAADIIHDAIASDDFSAKKLGRYEKSWKKLLGRELKVDYYARKLYEKLSDQQIEQLFNLIQSNGIHESLPKSRDFSFDWHSHIILGAFRHKILRKTIWAMTRSLFPF
ncbi:NAD(P)/FAD-dependent oxidoreductase, partial [Chloroflexota bacterium]